MSTPTIHLSPLPRASSAISATGYDKATKTLAILFTGSSTPKFFVPVPESVVDALLTAESAGKFYHQHIKGAYQSPAQADNEGASPD